jgi:predicted PurR-regulated permease PerM
MLTVFGCHASSICIKMILAVFLAILFDPLVVTREKLHLPRGVAARSVLEFRFSQMSTGGLTCFGPFWLFF